VPKEFCALNHLREFDFGGREGLGYLTGAAQAGSSSSSSSTTSSSVSSSTTSSKSTRGSKAKETLAHLAVFLYQLQPICISTAGHSCSCLACTVCGQLVCKLGMCAHRTLCLQQAHNAAL
jgi:hypothetical protein